MGMMGRVAAVLLMLMQLCMALRLEGALAGFEGSRQTQVDATWARVAANGASMPVRSLAVMAFDESTNQLVVFGGRNQDNVIFGDVWVFNTITSTWSLLEPTTTNNPVPRFSLNAGVIDSVLYIFGGEAEGDEILNDAWSFDLTSRAWTLLNDGSSNAPEPRYGAAGGTISFATGNFLVTSHGFEKRTRWDNTWAFNLATKEWTDITPSSGSIPTPRCLVSGAILPSESSTDTAILAMNGGCGSGGYGPCPSSETWMLTWNSTSGASQWTQNPECVYARNYGAMAGTTNLAGQNAFFLYGGSGGVLVGSDEPGQLNTILATSDATWAQQVLQGTQPPQPSGSQQSSMATTSAGVLYLLPGNTNELYTVNFQPYFGLATINEVTCHTNPVPAWRTAHGVMMGLSWGFLLPIGVFIARFGRIKDPLWFKLHRAIQATGVFLALFGFVIAILMVSTGKFLAVPHAWIGLVVTVIGVQQPLNAYFRPHVVKGEEKSKGRKCWEYWHKYSGRIGILLGLINPFWGIIYLSSSSSAGFIVYAIWVGIYCSAYLFLTMKGLPYERNGPSAIAQWINRTICCCLTPWDDSFQPRPRVEETKPAQASTMSEA